MMMRSKRTVFGEPAWLLSMAGAGALALVLSSSALAQRPGPPPVGKGAVGKISAVSATSLTVQFREGGSATFTASASIPVTLDGKTVTLSALAAGQFAAVSSTDGTTATKVDAHTRPGPPPGAPPPPNGPPPPDGPPPADGPPPGGPPPVDGPPPDGPPPFDGPPPPDGPPPADGPPPVE